MNDPKPSRRSGTGWIIAFILGGILGALIILLIMQERLLGAFWSFAG
ncbi:MAG: hypothetical protein JNJ53_00605 [Rhizobiales bacterium]|nr:hypothetical protein [Hyphomicrobiales bacterium]